MSDKSVNKDDTRTKPLSQAQIELALKAAQDLYAQGRYREALHVCEEVYQNDAHRTDNLLLLGAIHFQLRAFSESIFYNQQCIRVDPNFAEAYSNLGNSLKELGDLNGAVQFYTKAIKLKPRFCDAYNNLASTQMQLGQTQEAIETYQMALVLNPALVDAHSNLGNLYKAQGNAEAAKRSYLEAIRIKPDFAIAWSNLAGVFRDEGGASLDTSVAYYREAIRLCPEFADAHSNLGNALKDQGRLDEAAQSYANAVRIRPDFAIAHGNLGACLYSKGDIDGAIRSFRFALQLEPNFPDAYNNLGNALRDQGMATLREASLLKSTTNSDVKGIDLSEQGKAQLAEAIQCYRTALKFKPDHPHAYNNLGNALRDQGMIREAIHCYVTAIRLMPQFAAAHSNLGSVLKEQGQLEQALSHFQEAVSLEPLFAEAYSNMGNTYRDLGRHDEARTCYETAIKIKPDLADAHGNLGAVHKDAGRFADAISCYTRALELKPDFPDALANLVHSRLSFCDWSQWDSDRSRLLASLRAQMSMDSNIHPNSYPIDAISVAEISCKSADEACKEGSQIYPLPSVQPFHSLVYSLPLPEMLGIAQRYATRARMNVALYKPYPHPLRWTRGVRNKYRKHNNKNENNNNDENNNGENNNNSLAQMIHQSIDEQRGENNQQQVNNDDDDERIRIGYVSSDFGNHPLSHLMQSVFGMHDRSKFVVYCYATSASDGSQWRKRIETDADVFRDVSEHTASDIAGIIHADEVQVLFNLNGYTKGSKNEVFALRPSPVQVSYMGFPGTLGADYVEYVIADSTVIPTEHRSYYRERVVSMPHSYFVNDHKQSALSVTDPSQLPTRADYGVPEDKFIFCCFNQLYKIDPGIFNVWMNILKRVPNSVLWLLRFPADGEDNIRREALARGVRGDQLLFTDVVPKDEHLKRCFLADLFLDTPVYNAHTTGCDVLWSGTPLLTLVGEKMASRVAASLLRAIDMPELCVSTYEEYEELAVTLATDTEKLFQLRVRIEQIRFNSALFDTKRWVHNLEKGILSMWERFTKELPPDHIIIHDDAPIVMDNNQKSRTAKQLPPVPEPPRSDVLKASLAIHSSDNNGTSTSNNNDNQKVNNDTNNILNSENQSYDEYDDFVDDN